MNFYLISQKQLACHIGRKEKNIQSGVFAMYQEVQLFEKKKTAFVLQQGQSVMYLPTLNIPLGKVVDLYGQK